MKHSSASLSRGTILSVSDPGRLSGCHGPAQALAEV